MQANRGFVQNVHDPHQSGTNLAGQANALCLATREGISAAIQAEVLQPHIDQEIQPLTDFLDDFGRNFTPPPRQLEFRKKRPGRVDCHGGDGGQCLVQNIDMACAPIQSGPPTVGAGLVTLVAGQLFPYHVRLRVPVAALHIGNDPFEGLEFAVFTPAVVEIAEFNRLFTGTVQDQLFNGVRQLHIRHIHIEVVVLRKRGK